MKKIRIIASVLVAIMAVLMIQDKIVNHNIEEDQRVASYAKTPEDCEKVGSNTYRTGLIFNPPRRKTYYIKSECYLDFAVENEDAALCAFVKERKSLFLDGSWFSPSGCLDAIDQRKEITRRPN